MLILVIGYSGTGKTPFAKELAKEFDWQHISASGWVRPLFGKTEKDFPTKQAFIDAITRFSLEQLAWDPDISIKHLKSFDLTKHTIIDGIRNPRDFHAIFDPRTDYVINLHKYGAEPKSAFERKGVDNIVQYCKDNGDIVQYHFELFHKFYTSDDQGIGTSLEQLITSYKYFFKEMRNTTGFKDKILSEGNHQKIPNEDDGFFVDNPAIGSNLACDTISVTSYPGHVPTFNIMLDDYKHLYTYIPPYQLTSPFRDHSDRLDLEDLVYHNCPSETFVVNQLFSQYTRVNCYFKKKNLWVGGRYWFSMDWYLNNDLLHCVILDNGQVAFLPNHKIRFKSDNTPFPDYKKLREEYKVPNANSQDDS